MWTVQSPEPSLKHAFGMSQEILLIERVLYLPIWGKYTIIKEKQIIVSKKGGFTMKKLFSVLLALTLLLSMAACTTTEKKTEPATDTKSEAEKKTDDKADTKAEETKKEAAADVEVKGVFDVEITDAMKEKAKDFSVRLVTDVGGIDDRSFNQGTWEGVLKFSELTGANVNYAQSNSDADYIPSLSTFSEEGHDLIVATGFLFHDSIQEVSKTFPDQKYLLIDEVVEDCPNVVSAVFSEQQGSFLVGVAAGQAAKEAGKKVVGYIGGMDLETIQRFEAGYEAGVHAVDPNIEVKVEYVGSFDDTGKAQVLAKKLYDEGAYVIYHASGAAGNGMFKEAKERRLAGQDVWTIGVDRDQYDEGIYDKDGNKSCTLTSMVKRVDAASFTTAMMTLKDEFPGGQTLVFDMKNGGIDIPAENPNMSADAVKMVNEYKEKIKSGEIEVPAVPSRLKK